LTSAISGVRVLSKADSYSIVEAARVYRPHPDGLPPASASQLLVGYPGAGKTLVLKKMCWDLLFDSDYVPVYVAIEAYVSMVAGEATYTPDVSRAGPDSTMRSAINFLLGLALVDACLDAGLPDECGKAVRLLAAGSSGSDEPSAVGYQEWKQRCLRQLTASLSYGAPPPAFLDAAPTVYAVAKTLGDEVRKSGCTLVLLIDQVDRLRPFYFKALSSLLRRSSYFAIIASRPSPSAPNPSSVDHGAVDHSTYWLGRSRQNSDWSEFFADVVRSRSDLPDEIKVQMIERKEAIDSLFRPSVRRVITFTDSVRDQCEERGFDDAWEIALFQAIEDESNEAILSLQTVTRDPLGVIKNWQKRSDEKARASKSDRFTGSGFRLPADAALSERATGFIRLCVRDGIFVPRGLASPKFDQLSTRYEINPLVSAPPRFYKRMVRFKRDPKPFDIGVQEIEHWTSTRPPTHSRDPDRPVVVVVGPSAVELADSLKPALGGGATVEALQAGDDVWRLLGRARLLITDLTDSDPIASYAIGTAIARGVPVRPFDVRPSAAYERVAPRGRGRDGESLLLSTPRSSSRRDEAVQALIFELVELLRVPPSPTEAWTADAKGRSLNYRPSARGVFIVAAGDRLKEIEALVRSESTPEVDAPVTIDCETRGLRIDDIVKPARTSGLLMLDLQGASARGTGIGMLIAGAFGRHAAYVGDSRTRIPCDLVAREVDRRAFNRTGRGRREPRVHLVRSRDELATTFSRVLDDRSRALATPGRK
jgi:hypothetical protein